MLIKLFQVLNGYFSITISAVLIQQVWYVAEMTI